jgi:hypothetical protein
LPVFSNYMSLKSPILGGLVGTVRAVEGDGVGIVFGVEVVSHVSRVGCHVATLQTGQNSYTWVFNRNPVVRWCHVPPNICKLWQNAIERLGSTMDIFFKHFTMVSDHMLAKLIPSFTLNYTIIVVEIPMTIEATAFPKRRDNLPRSVDDIHGDIIYFTCWSLSTHRELIFLPRQVNPTFTQAERRSSRVHRAINSTHVRSTNHF